MSYIEQAKQENTDLLTGGESLEGNFVTPTVFSNCQDNQPHAQEEIFGPVVSLFKFDTESEVIQRANQTEFGLAGGVFTQDIQKGYRVAQALETGICWINNYNITPIEVPFGGSKHSGLGSENGWEALHDYTQVQTIYVEGDKVDYPY